VRSERRSRKGAWADRNAPLRGVRKKHAAENFSTVQKIALNLLKKVAGKESLRSKRLKAAWNKKFLAEILKS
jgi:hypothetical protein